jgi:hypothetical protein
MNKPGDKNYVDPDSPQPCENKRSVPTSFVPTKKYLENFDKIFRKPEKIDGT